MKLKDFNSLKSSSRKPVNITDFAGNLDDLANTHLEDKLKHLNTHENVEVNYLEKTSKSIKKTIAYYLNTANPLEWIFIVFYSMVLTFILFLFDLALDWGMSLRTSLCTTNNEFFNFIVWVISCVALLLAATSVGYYISPDADGSGIPEVKTVLSGISIYRYFSVEAFIGKTFGLWAALVGGATIGKVGPYVHISTIVCNRLMKIKFFSKINSSTATKNAMISAASAAGIALALGTPLGGVIFSMEVTSSIYLVSTIAKAFASTTVCIIFSKFLKATALGIKLFAAPEHLIPMNDTMIPLDITLCILLGLLSGVIGAIFSTAVSKLAYIRRKSNLKFLNSRFIYVIIVALITSIISFIVKPLMVYDRYMLTHLFSKDFPQKLEAMNHPHEGMLLFSLFLFKFLLTIITLAANIPAGIFGVFFLMGAYFGRFYGHMFKLIFNISDESIYAMIGASCVMSGATHSISAAIIIFELTGQVSYLLPLLLASVIANLTAQSLSLSFFDVFLLMKNLPHLPSIKPSALYHHTAENMTSKDVYPIALINFDFINCLEVLFKIPVRYSRAVSIPIIDSDGIIKYTVKPKNLTKLMYHIFESYKLNYESGVQKKIQQVILFLRRKVGKKYSSFYEYLRDKTEKIYKKKEDKEVTKAKQLLEEENIENLLLFLRDYSVHDDYILKSKIDLHDKTLNADRSAFCVEKNLPCLKLQFLFTFLNVSHVFVINTNGSLFGIIMKEDFVKKSMIMS